MTTKTNHYFRVLAVLAAMAISLLAALVEPAEAAFPGQNGRIAFASNRATFISPEGDYEIYTMKPDGTGLEQLTFNATDEQLPAFSPDGEEIVFESNRDGNREIYKMDANGTQQTRLINKAAFDLGPDWGPRPQ